MEDKPRAFEEKIMPIMDVVMERGTSRRNVIAALRADMKVLLMDAHDVKADDLFRTSVWAELESFKIGFPHLLNVGSNGTLYCVLRELNACDRSKRELLTEEEEIDHYVMQSSTRTHSGRIRFWPISLPESVQPVVESPLVFEDLKRVLLALETHAHGKPLQLEELDLTAVRLRDDDVPELVDLLRVLPRLTQIYLPKNGQRAMPTKTGPIGREGGLKCEPERGRFGAVHWSRTGSTVCGIKKASKCSGTGRLTNGQWAKESWELEAGMRTCRRETRRCARRFD